MSNPTNRRFASSPLERVSATRAVQPSAINPQRKSRQRTRLGSLPALGSMAAGRELHYRRSAVAQATGASASAGAADSALAARAVFALAFSSAFLRKAAPIFSLTFVALPTRSRR